MLVYHRLSHLKLLVPPSSLKKQGKMTEAIVSAVVETLGGLLVEEAKFLSGVTDQVQEVSRELKRMQCLLRDADTITDHRDETARNWLKEIRNLTYRAEDIVEAFAVEVASKRRGRGLKKVLTRLACIFCESRSLHNLGLEIAKVRTDITNLTTSNSGQFEGESSAGGATVTNENHKWARQTYAHEVEEYFVGMEEDMRKLVSLIIDDDHKHHPIISVWGMGGLGKTTIVRKLYKHRDVQRCFQRFAWVCITQQAQVRGILQDILLQLFPEKKKEIKDLEDRELVQQLYRVQTENKCLVVLDDIWYMHDWENLVHAFPVVEGRSKILLTTRAKDVAEIGFPYELECLNDKKSWELLKVIAFSRKGVQDLNTELKLEAVGIEMVHKCGGLPLAICVLGGILKDKDSLRDWQIVNKNIDSYLSTGKGSEEGSGGGAIARVLSLSYNALPYHLKPCFLYLGNFREDEEINAEQLYLLWMAEGMILSQHQRSGETLREVAERYLSELGQRSMLEVHAHKLSSFRRFESCHLHDMMRDFCLEKGRAEEFIGVIDLRGVKNPLLNSFPAVDRLVIHTNACYRSPY
ncbi:hypothetical protein ACH5RR_025307 [Cinchona calisaya]|uniref:Disease resistance protein At1g50180 n=1 Tax=Cinchona calisaya TaxID=153742 RepID=A0ABD2Z2M1_9GENT